MPINVRTRLPGPKAKQLMKVFQPHMGLYAPYYPFFPDSKNPGKGCYARDVDGNLFLDIASQIATQPLGYAHPRIVKVLKEYANAGTVQYAGHDFIPPEHGYMAKKLAEISKGLNPKFDAAFLVNSGAEAVENAMKICFRKKPSAKIGISCVGAFHGRTLGALSATNSKTVHKKHFPEIAMRRMPFADNAGDEQRALSFLEEMLEKDVDPGDVAFLIIEPVQGEGGYRFATKGFLRGLRKITKSSGIFLIDDEIQSGMGRTGKWFAMEHAGVKPDVVTMAKAVHVGATISSKKMFPHEKGAISSTFGGGNVLNLAIGLEIIKTIEQQKLIGMCKKMGEYFLKRLLELESAHSVVSNTRGVGLMLAFDLQSSKQDSMVEKNYKTGLLTLPCGPNSVRIIPPYIIGQEEIAEAIGVLDKNIGSL